MSVSGKVLTLTWKIVNVSLCPLKNGEILKSPVISTENFENTKWYLALYPKGVNKVNSGFISCFLYRNEECKENKNGFSTSCTLDLINPSGQILVSMGKCNLDKRGRGLYQFLKQERLTNDVESWKNDILEVRCQLFDTNYNGPPIVCETRTEIQMKKYFFDWKIEIPEFQDWSKILNYPLEEEILIKITLTAPGDKICIKIQEPKETSSDLRKLKISILNKKGIDIDLKNSSYAFDSPEFETSFEKKMLEDESGFTFIYSFNFLCAIYISDGTSKSTFVSYENTPDEGFHQLAIPRLSLQNDLKGMLLNKKYCDAKLQAGGDIIEVHKCLLSARSPVFSAMFDGEMLEGQTGTVDIPDVESEVLRSFVEFLYTDTFTDTDHEHILKLILVADKYQVDILKEGCSEILISKLSLENVCEVISVADMVNQLSLKQLALNYIKTNKMMILRSPDWLAWVEKNMKLAIEILTKLSID